MGSVIKLFRISAFDPETVEMLCRAYDKACNSLHDEGQPDLVNEIIAQRIISLAQQGEHNPDRLYEYSLKALDGTKAAINES